ncbi:MAG: addiction module protein [Gemmatimonadetes bacterium]|nr:addiction module protein [Gemmatimonadota bacterium]
MSKLENIEREAYGLSTGEKIELLHRLTLHIEELKLPEKEENAAEWKKEIEERVSKAKINGLVGRSMEEISQDIRKKYA